MSMQLLLSVTGQVLVVVGALVFSTAGIGIVRFKDAYSRSSAIATAAGLGISLVLIGAFLLQPGGWTALKLAVAVVMQLATSAVGSMALARSAYLTGSPMHHAEGHDHLDDALAVDGRRGEQP